jgi:PhnB protein
MTNMTANVKPVPDGYHTITPYIIIKDAERAIEFYKKSFNAKVIVCMDLIIRVSCMQKL